MLTADRATTVPQHLRALEAANTKRCARAEMKRGLAEATRSEALERCADLLLDPPDAAEGMTVGTLLAACHRVGPFQARRLLGRMRPPVSETVLVEHLTLKRAMELAGVLRRAAG